MHFFDRILTMAQCLLPLRLPNPPTCHSSSTLLSKSLPNVLGLSCLGWARREYDRTWPKYSWSPSCSAHQRICMSKRRRRGRRREKNKIGRKLNALWEFEPTHFPDLLVRNAMMMLAKLSWMNSIKMKES